MGGHHLRRALALALCCFASVPVSAAADAPTGFAICATCHGAHGEGSDAGPELRGVLGRKAASGTDFAYSAAMRRSGKVWTEAEIAAFLLNPQAAVPGTRMAYPGASTPAEAAALAAYVAMLK
ncbi:c-type cytochrome [Novosphingobium sp. KACC 22771]|uniref:c-type cytochrome n=1 Tax=Novosphingobium sp. KACC 22771 TaxID=3025670 RepID=UPI00236689B9|nr:c-type cytochrome [Novosphingobium sp. KACC 22771]WDF75166.1 c-type cytochrome [Novosphingobium sp. KACC 22771]